MVRPVAEQADIAGSGLEAFVRALGHPQVVLLDPEEALLGMAGGHGGDEFAVAEADVDAQPVRLGIAEQRRQVERGLAAFSDQRRLLGVALAVALHAGGDHAGVLAWAWVPRRARAEAQAYPLAGRGQTPALRVAAGRPALTPEPRPEQAAGCP